MISKKELKLEKKQIVAKHSRAISGNINRSCATVYAEFYNKCKVNENVILYEAFFGRGVICNVNGLFQAFMKRKDFNLYTHVWVLDDFEGNARIVEDYKQYKNVIFVEFLSNEYLKYLASAKYLINNVTFPPYFTKKKEQVYLNTWHGIPLKTLGYDQVNGSVEVANTIRNFLCADYLLSPCSYQTEIYKKAFKLEGIYEGKIIEEGQPRNDLSLTGDRKEILEKMRRNGVEVHPDKKIILYAPTWKGQRYANPTIDIDEYYDFIRVMEKQVSLDEYQILVKPHQLVYQYIKNDGRMTGQFVPAILDANEVLSVTDILISDYSSIYFDFMVTGRPILFYIPDVDEYKNYRGLYFPMDELPGPYTKTLSELPVWIADIYKIEQKYKEKYQDHLDKFVYLDDGNVADKILQYIFDRKDSCHIVEVGRTKKKKILAYIGVTRMNGITESFNSLLNSIDYDKFDVTVIGIASMQQIEVDKLCSFHPNARVLTQVGNMNATKKEAVDNDIVLTIGMEHPDLSKYYSEAFYEKEYRRKFGDCKFDYIVNFTGYSPFYSILLLQAKEAKKFIWLHNDLYRELQNDTKENEYVLNTVFSVYPYYDKMVSCSESVMEVNRKYLSTDVTYDKFSYCRNIVNFSRVFEGLKSDQVLNVEECYYVKSESTEKNSAVINMEYLTLPDEGKMNFVTMGRMSSEKNHKKLILAFSRFYQEEKNARLYILGDGPLRFDLEALLHKEGCEDAVYLLGNVANPFGLMKHCQCFILPSNYEGQPMVLLEARAMGLPIIVSDFSTVKDSLFENGQLLIGQDIDSIYKSLKAFKEGRVPRMEFDYEGYNKKAYQEFERLFD